MRLFEILILLICTTFPFLLSFNYFKKSKWLSMATMAVIFILHALFEGLRWQMLPGYGVLLIIFLMVLRERKLLNGNRVLKAITLFFLPISLMIGWFLPISFPVFSLPSPGGAYQTGTQYIKIVTDEPEMITQDPKDKRSFMVKVWYPSEVKNEKKTPYLDQGNRLGFSTKYGLPKFITHYFDYVKTNTYEGPSLAKGSFPVLIFSHGYYSDAFGYYALMEEIASHGFIVFNINHTFESSGSLFPEGKIKLYDQAYDQETNNQEMAEMAWNATQNYLKADHEKDRLLAVEDLIRNYVAADISIRWSKDISTVIDHLPGWNESSFLAGHLETSKIGVFGHSQGGSAAGQAMIDDPRIQAGINLDGAQWGPLIDTTITKPFVLISSEWDEDHPNLNKYAYRNLRDGNFKSILIRNTGHSNFMDIPLIVNVPFINEAGTIDPYQGYEIITSLILDFFHHSLNGNKEDWDPLIQNYEEIEIVKN